MSTATNRELRTYTLNHLGVEPAYRDELLSRNVLEYCFDPTLSLEFPWPDEPFVAAWEVYARAVNEAGTLRVLDRYLPQLRFPVHAGMSQDPSYIAVTRKGAPASLLAPATHSDWTSPAKGLVFLRPTPAGRVPCIYAAHRADFVYLVRALSKKNEPLAIPESMGACVVGGYNNWDRVAACREQFVLQNGTSGWTAELDRLLRSNRSMFQDSFLILSGGPYSGVPAAALGLSESDWLHASLQIRQAHEAAHYFTRRVLGSARNHVNDEAVCDFFAMTRVFPAFDGVVFLRFFGLEDYPRYREGGRLQNYRGTPRLTDGAFEGLQRVLFLVAENLENLDRQLRQELRTQRNEAAMLLALCQFTIEEMAASGFVARYQSAFHQSRKFCQQESEFNPKRNEEQSI